MLLVPGFNGGGGAEKFREIDLQVPDAPFLRTGDCGGLVAGKNDGVFRADATAGGATFFAVVLFLDENSIQIVDAVHAEQTKIDALHAIGAAAVVDDRIPTATHRLVRFRDVPVSIPTGGTIAVAG